MLRVFFGDMPEAVYNTSVYFDNTYLDSWITNEESKKIIKSIDKAEVLSAGAVESSVLGVIPVKQLSGGTKTLLLLKFDDSRIFNVSTCGDNCAKWILKIAEESEKDLTVNLHHLMNFGEEPFEIMIANDNTVVKNAKEYVLSAAKYL